MMKDLAREYERRAHQVAVICDILEKDEIHHRVTKFDRYRLDIIEKIAQNPEQKLRGLLTSETAQNALLQGLMSEFENNEINYYCQLMRQKTDPTNRQFSQIHLETYTVHHGRYLNDAYRLPEIARIIDAAKHWGRFNAINDLMNMIEDDIPLIAYRREFAIDVMRATNLGRSPNIMQGSLPTNLAGVSVDYLYSRHEALPLRSIQINPIQ